MCVLYTSVRCLQDICYYQRNFVFHKKWSLSLTSAKAILWLEINVKNVTYSVDVHSWNESFSWLFFFFVQQSLTILKIKANFTAFMPLQPVIIMWSRAQWLAGMRNTWTGPVRTRMTSSSTRVPLLVSEFKLNLISWCLEFGDFFLGLEKALSVGQIRGREIRWCNSK